MPKQKEIWKQITIHELRGTYKISENGKVVKMGHYLKTTGEWRSDKLMTPQEQSKKKPYLRVVLSRDGYQKQFYIHRLVAMFFLSNPDNKPHINHIDGNKKNNHYTNLEWCTPQENNEHGKRLGLFDGYSKVPKWQRKFIKENFFTVGRQKLAEMFGLTEGYVLKVAKVKVNGTSQRKKYKPHYKKIIDTETGKEYTSEEVAALLNIKRRYVHRMLNEDRKQNTSQFRYA